MSREQEFYQELMEITREKLKLYCSVAVETEENGALAKIRGKLLFQQELKRLTETVFTEEEKKQYQLFMIPILDRERALYRKAAEDLKEGVLLGLPYLCRILQLSELERQLITFCLMPELDSQFERIYSLLQDDYDRKSPSPELVFRILTLDEGERLLWQQRMIERIPILRWIFDGEIRMAEPLQLNQRILQFILDICSGNPKLESYMKVTLPGNVQMPVIRKEFPEKVRKLVENQNGIGKAFLYLFGKNGIGKKELAKVYSAELGRQFLEINAEEVLASPNMRELVEELFRESVLRGHAVLCFVDAVLSEEPDEHSRRLEKLLSMLTEYQDMAILTCNRSLPPYIRTQGMRPLQVELPDTTCEERMLLWQDTLSKERWPEGLDIRTVASKYVLTPGDIRKSVEDALQEMELKGETRVSREQLFHSCQKQLIHKLGSDAIKITSPYQWKDLVLPQNQKRLLKDACDQVAYRDRIYQEWGMKRKVAYGRGTSVIFYGPPGTGKTMGAQVMANQLNLELYKVNMASVMSRYVGDSEKRLEQIFEQGKNSQSILFFDEADVLFGKRSETKDAQDKYTNASTAYLLQKVEEYEGILILATNFLQNFDNAFCRRFKFIIEFPFPDQNCRKKIWDQMFPKEMHMDEQIDTEWLAAEFKFSGSQIKNIVLAASFLAAGEQKGLCMKHILTALKREQLKDGKQMIASDFGKYYYLMEEA